MMAVDSHSIHADLLIVGAGPAGVAAALALSSRFRRMKIEKTIMVVKSAGPGLLILSGAIIRKRILSMLALLVTFTPLYMQFKNSVQPVTYDGLFFQSPQLSIAVPTSLLPGNLRHRNDVIASAGLLCKWLLQECKTRGVAVLFGLPAGDFIIENNAIRGIVIPEGGFYSLPECGY